MPSYDFRSLSSLEFEELVRDLLQAQMGVTLESFKAGRDHGIDLRYSGVPGQNIIVQCKHYANSSVSSLLSHLRLELRKVQAIRPARYIVACSLGLTPANKDSIATLLKPFILSSSDIYGANDLNNLLGLFPDIERTNFKLWLTSQTVLDRILHARMYNQQRIGLEDIEYKRRLYVQNPSFQRASEILDEHHVCVITGIPGIGKSTLAEILILRHLEAGFGFFMVSDDISEAFEVLNPTEKQVFYYDDFLGQTALKQKLGKNEDQRLVQFIRSVHNNSHIRLILTTRDYILRDAQTTYEKLARYQEGANTCVLELADYATPIKARILYNHLYFASLPQEVLDDFVLTARYREVVEHKNYNPRLIEWSVNAVQTGIYPAREFSTQLIEALDNPTHVWEHAFLNQLDNGCRDLLLCMSSMPREIFLADLRRAFDQLHQRNSATNGWAIAPRAFQNAVRILEGNFITLKMNSDTEDRVEFHNPSIRDFLVRFLKGNPQEVTTILDTAVFFDQITTLMEFVGQEFPHRSALVSALERGYAAPVSKVIEIHTGITVIKGRQTSPAEERLPLVIGALGREPEHGLVMVVRKMTALVIRRMCDGSAVCWYLDKACTIIIKNAEMLGLDAKRVFKAAERYLKHHSDSIDVLEFYIELLERNCKIDRNNREELKELFQASVELELDRFRGDRSQAKWAGNCAETVSKIGKSLKADFGPFIDELEMLYQESEDPEPEYDREMRRFNVEPERGEFVMDDMFQSLIERPPTEQSKT